MQRFIRGTVDEKIKTAWHRRRDGSRRNAQSQRRRLATRKNQLTDEELRAFFAEAKKQADEAGVAEQPEQVDPRKKSARSLTKPISHGSPAGRAGRAGGGLRKYRRVRLLRPLRQHPPRSRASPRRRTAWRTGHREKVVAGVYASFHRD